MNEITPERLAASDTEDGHQLALACWSRSPKITEQYPDLFWLFAIPNGSERHKAVALKLKAMGVKRGIPDMCLAVRRGSWAALWIELKRPELKDGKGVLRRAGQVSKEQSVWGEHLKTQGHAFVVAKGWDQAREMIISYLEWKPE